LHERLPLRRVGKARDNEAEKTEHAEPLREIEARHGKNAEERSNQSGADKTFLSRCIDKKCQPQQGKSGLRKDT
jgi:hypothetical protein